MYYCKIKNPIFWFNFDKIQAKIHALHFYKDRKDVQKDIFSNFVRNSFGITGSNHHTGNNLRQYGFAGKHRYAYLGQSRTQQ